MVFHMKTTLVISDPIFRRLKVTAARTGRTMSELVDAALRSFLTPERGGAKSLKLPLFHLGRSKVDVADRNALYDAMEKDDVRR